MFSRWKSTFLIAMWVNCYLRAWDNCYTIDENRKWNIIRGFYFIGFFGLVLKYFSLRYLKFNFLGINYDCFLINQK